VEENKSIQRLGVVDQVGHVDGDDLALAQYYRNAAVFVFPSLYEGFGLPVLEAMGQNCPVICSDAGSLREIGGDAVAYFDPRDVESMQRVMEQTLGNTERLDDLRRLGSARHKLFSWDKCAQQTADVYRQLTQRSA
jgi:glycosyltransferase involved in cell wall biosynthesis